MKKIFALLLPLLLLLPFASGCGPAEPAGYVTPTVPTFTEDPDPDLTQPAGSFNVLDFGAVGDGAGDESEALTAAVQAAKGPAGGTVWFPAGTYRIESSWRVPQEVACAFARGATLVISGRATVTFEGTVIAGRWEVFEGSFRGMLANEQVFPQWFGAVGDGVHNDTAALCRTLEHSRDVALPYTDGGYLLGAVDVPEKTRIHGYNGKKATVIGQPDSEYIFCFNDGYTYSKVYDLVFRMGNAGEAACFFFNAAGRQLLTHIEIYDVVTEGAFHVVQDAHISGAIISDIVVRDMICLNSRGIAFDTDNFWGFCFLRDSIFDNSGVRAAYGEDAGNCAAVSIGDNAGFIIQNNLVVGSGDPNCDEEYGFEYHNNVATWMDHCTVRQTGSDAFHITGGSHLYFSEITAEGMFGNGMDLSSTYWLQLLNVQVTGLAGKGSSAAEGQIGVYFKNVVGGQANGVTVRGSAGNGIMSVCNQCALTRLTVTGCDRNGVVVAGVHSVYTDVTVSDCAGGPLQVLQNPNIVTRVTLNGTAYEVYEEGAD